MGKKIKVVFDTNIWISIFMEDILYDEFSQVKQDLRIYTSKDINLELSKVLVYPKIARALEKNGIRQKDVLRTIAIESTIVEPKMKLKVLNDTEDNKILECALEAGADIILSGDKHLLELRKFKKTKILAPREFFDSLKRK